MNPGTGALILVGTFAGGFAAGYLATKGKAERDADQRYLEWTESMKRVWDKVDGEIDFNEVTHQVEPIAVSDGYKSNYVDKGIAEEIINYSEYALPLPTAEELSEAEKVVPNSDSDAIEYITEEDFDADIEFQKNTVMIVMEEFEPQYTLNGEPLSTHEAETLLGPSLLVDFFVRVPPGEEAILYVRNTETFDDFEVSRVNP